MITVYGEGRGFRVVWLLEEMGLPYRLGLIRGHYTNWLLSPFGFRPRRAGASLRSSAASCSFIHASPASGRPTMAKIRIEL